MTKIIFVLATIISMTASAATLAATNNFNGNWRGQGTYQGPGGKRNCALISFNVQQTTTTIGVGGGQMRCQDKIVNIQSVSGTITKDGRITVWGIAIGSINGGSLNIDTSMGRGGRKILQLRNGGNNMSMSFTRVENGISERITANLRR